MVREKERKGDAGPAVRQRLLSAALELFNEKGYYATSVREIVETAGVTKPVLYYYFQNKEGIYLSLMQDTYAIFEQIVARVATSPGTVRDRVTQFALGIFDGFTSQIDVVRLIYAIYFGPPQGAPPFPLDNYYDTMIAMVSGLVTEGMASGELRPVDVKILTWAIISAMNTVMEEQLCRNPPRIDRDGLTAIIAIIFNSVALNGKQS